MHDNNYRPNMPPVNDPRARFAPYYKRPPLEKSPIYNGVGSCKDFHIEKRLGKLQTVKAAESVKVIELKDAFDNLRYKIVLTSIDVPMTGVDTSIDELTSPTGKLYEVEVVNCFLAPNPLVIAHRPNPDEKITSYEVAIDIFKQYAFAYARLIQADTKDLQDISVYKDTIGYEVTCPECCGTCKFARVKKTGKDFVCGVTGRLECHNPKNMLSYDFNTEPMKNKPPIPPCGPHFSTPVDNKVMIYPNVKIFGKCSNYEKATRRPFRPADGDSVGDLVDRKLNAALADITNYVQHATDTETIMTEVVNVVGNEIDSRLNSGDFVVEGNRDVGDYNGDGVVDGLDDLAMDGVVIGGQGA